MNLKDPERNNQSHDDWSLETLGQDKQSLPKRNKYFADYVYPVGALIALIVTLSLFFLK